MLKRAEVLLALPPAPLILFTAVGGGFLTGAVLGLSCSFFFFFSSSLLFFSSSLSLSFSSLIIYKASVTFLCTLFLFYPFFPSPASLITFFLGWLRQSPSLFLIGQVFISTQWSLGLLILYSC